MSDHWWCLTLVKVEFTRFLHCKVIFPNLSVLYSLEASHKHNSHLREWEVKFYLVKVGLSHKFSWILWEICLFSSSPCPFFSLLSFSFFHHLFIFVWTYGHFLYFCLKSNTTWFCCILGHGSSIGCSSCISAPTWEPAISLGSLSFFHWRILLEIKMCALGLSTKFWPDSIKPVPGYEGQVFSFSESNHNIFLDCKQNTSN